MGTLRNNESVTLKDGRDTEARDRVKNEHCRWKWMPRALGWLVGHTGRLGAPQDPDLGAPRRLCRGTLRCPGAKEAGNFQMLHSVFYLIFSTFVTTLKFFKNGKNNDQKSRKAKIMVKQIPV